MTFSARRSESSSWTSDSDGLTGSFDITTQAGLELAKAQVLHLAPEETSLHLEAADALQRLVGKSVELARIDKQADRELLSVLFSIFRKPPTLPASTSIGLLMIEMLVE